MGREVPGVDMSERVYICAACETEIESFPEKCPECGGSEFRTEVCESDAEEELIDEVAKLSRPLNPVAPA